MMRAMTMQPPRDVPLLHPACPSCGRALRFARTVPGTQGLAELQTFSCRECSLWITESQTTFSWNGPKARNDFFFRLPPTSQPRALASLALGSSFARPFALRRLAWAV